MYLCKVFKWSKMVGKHIRKETDQTMQLSMWIVYDWLKKYSPEAHIQDGQQIISGVRFLAEDVELNRSYLYIGQSRQYIDPWDDHVVCVNGPDLIMLNLRDIYVVFNEIQQMLEYYNNWETGLMQELYSGNDLEAFLSRAVPVIQTGLAVSDLSRKVLCHVAYDGRPEKLQLEKGYLKLEEMQQINRQHQENRSNHSPYFVQSSQDLDIVFNLFSRSDRLAGCLISLSGGEGESVHSRMQLMDVFGRLLNLWLLLHEEVLSELTIFRDILEMKETDPEIIALRMLGMGWNEDPQMQLFLICPCTAVTLGVPYVIRFLEEQYRGIHSFQYREQYLLIVNYRITDRARFQEELVRLMEKQSAYCGCSHIFTDLEHLNQNYMQASFAAEYGTKSAGSLNRCEDYALEYMKDRFREAVDADLASPALEKLRKYDIDNGTEYYRTLFTYLLCERNQTLTAERLFLHRNTLIYRVNRIEEIIDTDLNKERERLYLLLSYLVQSDIGRLERI